MAFLTRFLPFLAWFKGYNTGILRADVIAGVTVALVLIPQSMAYAQLAGLPAYYGLYAAVLPPMVASLFGSSNQLATGPVAVVSLMTAATLEPLATAGSTQYVQYALLLALLVGLFQMSLGLLRLGMIVNFLSHPVVNGFTNAAALIIATSQLSKIFGVTVEKAEHHCETVYRVVVAALHGTHWLTLGMAILALSVMVGLKKLNPRIPNVLIVVILTTLLSLAIGFHKERQVALSEIEAPEVAASVQAFNAVLAEKAEMARALKEKDAAAAARLLGAERSEPGASPEDALAALKAGMTETAGRLDALRSQLRKCRFAAVEGPDGARAYFLRDAVPEGAAADDGRWHLTVGEERLDVSALALGGGGAIVATIPEGLPPLALPGLDWSVIPRLFAMAMIISLIGFMEAISIARAIASRTQQRLNPNQELVGQGLSNIIGCIGRSYPVSGSFSRSAVNLQAGGVTGLSNVISSLVVILVLLFLTPTLYHLPQAVLASIIMMAVIGLVNVEGFVHSWRAMRFDGITSVVTFVATLAFAPHLEFGIALGVTLSLGHYLYRSTRPNAAVLSLHPDGSWRDARRHGLAMCEHIAAIRFDGPLNFASVSFMEDQVLERAAAMPHLKYVLIVGHGISEIDASGEEMLGRLVARLRETGHEIHISGFHDHILDALRRTHLYETIGDEHMSPTRHTALERIHARAHVDSTEKDCPLLHPIVCDPAAAARGATR